MRKAHIKRVAAPISVLILGLSAAPQAQAAVYGGNGATGFGGPVGNGALTVTDDDNGNVTFSFEAAGGSLGGAAPSNDLVIYLSTGATGLTSTSSLVSDVDNGDEGRRAVAGADSTNGTSTLVSFATGFQATYALSIEDNYVSLFSLPLPGTVNYLTYITGAAQTGEPDTLTLPLADLGLSQGSSFEFAGTLISTQASSGDATPAYRSNETIGPAVITPGPDGGSNVGSTGTVAFTGYDTYASTAVPEPAGLAVLGLGGLLATRRRSHSVAGSAAK